MHIDTIIKLMTTYMYMYMYVWLILFTLLEYKKKKRKCPLQTLIIYAMFLGILKDSSVERIILEYFDSEIFTVNNQIEDGVKCGLSLGILMNGSIRLVVSGSLPYVSNKEQNEKGVSKRFLTVDKQQIDLYTGNVISKYAIIKHQVRPCIHKREMKRKRKNES